MYLDISPPLTSNFAALVVREVEEDRLHHRTYIHAHIYTRGTKEAGGEFDRRIFNAIKNKPLPSRACLIFSRAWIATRRDATRRVALSNGNKLRISRRGEIFIARSVHWRRRREGGRRLVNTGSPSTRGNLFATDSSIDRAEFGWAARGRPLNRRFVTDPFCRSDDKQTGTRRPLTRRIHNRNIHVRFECVYVISDDRDFVGTRRFAFSS